MNRGNLEAQFRQVMPTLTPDQVQYLLDVVKFECFEAFNEGFNEGLDKGWQNGYDACYDSERGRA
jgi:hypothetical protein